jgi:LPXTG-motif cell wall-anchored protein
VGDDAGTGEAHPDVIAVVGAVLLVAAAVAFLVVRRWAEARRRSGR